MRCDLVDNQCLLSPTLISGGFYVTRAISRPNGLGDILLPERLITLSSCLTEFLPDWWALNSTSCSTGERVAALQKLGLPQKLLPALQESATAAFNLGDLGWPCVWQSAHAARAALALIEHASAEFIILELGVPEDAAAMLLDELAPRPSDAECGFLKRLRSASALESPSVQVGWEVLGAELGGSFHSWLCNSIHDDASTKLNIKPGPFGLIPSAQAAQAVVDLIESGVGAEPVPWFTGLISRLP